MELEDENTTHRDSNRRWLPGKSANPADQKMTLHTDQITVTNLALPDADIVTGDLDMTSSGKFIAYYRVSTDRQGKSGLGLEAQRQAVANYLNGGDWKIIAEFTEVESGRRSDRPQLDAALKAARLHRAAIVVSKVDRLTRSLSFLLKLLEANVDVRFADLPQIEGPTGRFLLQQMASVAELEAGMISKRTKEALAAAKKRGTKLGGIRRRVISVDERGRKTYGEQVLNVSSKTRKLAVKALQERTDARATDLAPTIKNLQAAGKTSLRAIAEGLNEQGIPTARGGEWSAVQVMRVLERLDPFREEEAA
jgi:DNA invertase Pin-like site-specific DNA recombinase